MAKKYLEIIEQLTEEEALTKQPQMMRVEVQDIAEAKLKAVDYEEMFSGLKHKKWFHEHRKSEDEGCNWVDLDKAA